MTGSQDKGLCSSEGRIMFRLGSIDTKVNQILTVVCANSTATKSTGFTFPWQKIVESLIRLFGPQLLPFILAALGAIGTAIVTAWKWFLPYLRGLVGL